MSLQNRALSVALTLFCLSALCHPRDVRAQWEDFSPTGLASESLSEWQADSAPQVELTLTLRENPAGSDPESDLHSSDGAETQSFSLQKPLLLGPGSAEVTYYLERFQTGDRRAVVERWIERSGRYAGMIEAVLRDKGLPEDLMFTAMIESGFNPVAVSRAGAKGLWQFMAATARRYGLRVDRWVDERLDPEKSTVAAARYLSDLFALFGSWELAKAAYNAGEMKVLRAIRTLGTSDFWALTRGRILKEETKNFVPAIQAATLIGREPERYGFAASQTEPLAYESAPAPAGLTLARAAALAGVGVEDLLALNAELRLKQTPPGAPYLLKFPVGASERFVEAQERLRGRRLVTASRGPQTAKPEVHVVQPKETVSTIAKRYGVSTSELTRWNELDEAGRIRPGDRLRIASAAPAD